jgi:hypothetical protein
MNQTITKRLSRDTSYKPRDDTYQSSLSDVDIAKKLDDYERVKTSDIFKIPLGTHIRYFSINPKTGEKQFRLGGNLTKYGENGEYVICSNGTYSWSVQLSNSIIYKKLSISELKEHTKKNVIDTSKKEMSDLIKENKELKKMIKEIKEATITAKENKKTKK